jgi:hypothetical protein
VQVVLKTNPRTGLQRVSIEHVPATNIIWDRLERNPARSPFMAFVKYLGREEAEQRFGKKVADRYVHGLFENASGSYASTTNPIEAMRVIEYYDTGFGKRGVPTRAIIADDLGGEVIELAENEFETVPFAPYVHFVTPGMRRPVGRVLLQMATQEAINEFERHMRSAMKQIPYDLVDVDQIDPDDLQRITDGDFDGPPIKWNASKGMEPVHRIPGMDVSQSTLAWGARLEDQFTTDSGTSEFERGQFSPTSRTLGENQLVDERSKVQGVWSTLQMTLFQRRKIAKVLDVAARFDRDPLTVSIFGHPVPLNDPRFPQSSIAAFLEQKSRVVVDTDSLAFSDLGMKRQQKLNELNTLAPLVQMGQISPQWYTQECLQAIGYDPAEAMRDAPAAQQQPRPPTPEKLMIDYKDAPPDIQRQMEAMAGFQPSQAPPK